MVTVVIPAYNPENSMIDLVKKLVVNDDIDVIVVNDGSDIEYLYIFDEIAECNKITVLSHAINLGKGQALKTAFNFFLSNKNVDYSMGVVTADADGQHRYEDIMSLVQCLNDNNAEFVLGVRDFGKDVPARSRIGNKLTAFMSKILLGRKISDTQTGLRGIKRELLKKIIKLPSSGYEFEMEMLVLAIHLGIKIQEIPIATVYIDGNKSSHFRPIRDSLLIYFVLLRHLVNSILTSVIDYFAFAAFLISGSSILGAMIFGRFVACVFNFCVGKTFVFKSNNNVKVEIFRYLILVLSIMTISYASINLLYAYLQISPFVSKIFVEVFLFIISFVVQRVFVFSNLDKSV